jgi:hypothetical protein
MNLLVDLLLRIDPKNVSPEEQSDIWSHFVD